jgi:hypothetical protein
MRSKKRFVTTAIPIIVRAATRNKSQGGTAPFFICGDADCAFDIMESENPKPEA